MAKLNAYMGTNACQTNEGANYRSSSLAGCAHPEEHTCSAHINPLCTKRSAINQ